MDEINEALPMASGAWALFLDVDGTLIDIAETPDAVQVPAELPQQIARLSESLSGALALVSGRSIASLDALFEPYLFPAAGLHGMEMRSAADGSVKRPTIDQDELGVARHTLGDLAQRWPGIIVEDKKIGFAVHYRLAPQAAGEVDRSIEALLLRLGPDWTRQDGKMVVEIRPSGTSKADAVARLMSAAPFLGRTPIAVGDDLTDETMFAYANGVRGRSVKVGISQHPTLAQFNVKSPQAIREWIARLAATSPP